MPEEYKCDACGETFEKKMEKVAHENFNLCDSEEESTPEGESEEENNKSESGVSGGLLALILLGGYKLLRG